VLSAEAGLEGVDEAGEEGEDPSDLDDTATATPRGTANSTSGNGPAARLLTSVEADFEDAALPAPFAAVVAAVVAEPVEAVPVEAKTALLPQQPDLLSSIGPSERAEAPLEPTPRP